MSFLKTIFEDVTALKSLGTEARVSARDAHTASFFSDPENEGRILVGHADGSVTPQGLPADQQRKSAMR